MPILSLSQLYNEKNVPRTRELFYEYRFNTRNPEDKEPIFTVGNIPQEGYIPLFKLYMQLAVDDPSEMTFVEEIFGDYHYWEVLCSSAFFKPLIERWRNIASVKRKQQAFKAIIEQAKSEERSPAKLSAAKYLIEEPWRGGPTAADRKKARAKAKETSEEAYQSEQIQSDINRLKEEGILQ